jgi:hypothetical protein
METNASDRVYTLFKHYLMNDLETIMTFKQFAERVVLGHYPHLLVGPYKDNVDLLKSDLETLKTQTGWL